MSTILGEVHFVIFNRLTEFAFFSVSSPSGALPIEQQPCQLDVNKCNHLLRLNNL